jgi:DNA primase
MEYSRSAGINEALLLETGLTAISKERTFDYFRNRIMIPLTDSTNRVIGFTGRDFSGSKDAPKYFNTQETALFKKSKTLFGLPFAKQLAKATGSMFLVEGNADVIKMHQLGIHNTVCSGGTALTPDQVEIHKKYVSCVIIIGDSDKAGQNAVARSAEMLLRAGLFVSIISLPVPEAKEKKNDPDSFFTSQDMFKEFEASHKTDYIIHYCKNNVPKNLDAHAQSNLVTFLSELISFLPASSHNTYLDELAKVRKPKKIWEDGLKKFKEEPEKDKTRKYYLPEGVDPAFYEKYGFYSYKGAYSFDTQKGDVKCSNFTLEPLFHVASYIN